MIWTSNKGEGGEDGRFALKCGVCGKIYLLAVLDPGQIYQFELPMPQVPCHADSLEVVPSEADPWVRVARLFGLNKPGEFGKFEYTLTMQDGALCQVSIRREG